MESFPLALFVRHVLVGQLSMGVNEREKISWYTSNLCPATGAAAAQTNKKHYENGQYRYTLVFFSPKHTVNANLYLHKKGLTKNTAA